MPTEEDPVLAALDYNLPESGHWTTDDLDALCRLPPPPFTKLSPCVLASHSTPPARPIST